MASELSPEAAAYLNDLRALSAEELEAKRRAEDSAERAQWKAGLRALQERRQRNAEQKRGRR